MAALVVLVLPVLTTTGCFGATKIGDILADSSQYEGKVLTVKGTVGETVWFALFEKGAYQIGDGSGTIWVITGQPPPEEGQSVSAKGEIKSTFSIGDNSYGMVLEETGRN